jgi:hypothetical protein
VANREVVLLRDEDQALAAHAKGGKKGSHFQKETNFHKESHPPKRFQKYHKGPKKGKYFSSYQCYHCDKKETLLRIVLPEGKNTRREITKDIMLMQLKMMSHPRSRLKKRLKIMFCFHPSQDL